MKIVILSREYPPDTAWGGLAIVYHSLACALVQRGHEVHVICQAMGKSRESVEDGVFVYRVGTNSKRYNAASRVNYSLYAWLKLRSIINSRKIDIVEANYWGAEAFFTVCINVYH
jgi:glycogen synthase